MGIIIPLSERHRSRRILQLCKIENNRIRPCLLSQLYSLEVYEEIFPDAISSGNVLITHFTNKSSINKLKSHFLSLVRPKRGFYRNSLLISAFRLDVSPLRSRKKRVEDLLDTLEIQRIRLNFLVVFQNFNGAYIGYIYDYHVVHLTSNKLDDRFYEWVSTNCGHSVMDLNMDANMDHPYAPLELKIFIFHAY